MPILLFNFLLLALTAVLCFSPIIGIQNSANSIFLVLFGFTFVLLHGSSALGWRNLLVFLVITIIVSFSAEAIGVATGWVFGKYHYSDHLGPKLLGVPPLIQMAYIAMGYSSLMMARIILRSNIRNLSSSLLGVVLIGVFIMVSWDVVMDPYQSTVAGDWIWEEGGPYFGIGIHNYVGWFITVFIFMFLYQLYSKFYPESPNQKLIESKLFWTQPIIYYGLLGLEIILFPFISQIAMPYASPTNYTGNPDSLAWSLSLVGFFLMGMPIVIAFANLLIHRKK